MLKLKKIWLNNSFIFKSDDAEDNYFEKNVTMSKNLHIDVPTMKDV